MAVVAAGHAVVATAGVANATCLAVTGRAGVTGACRVAVAAAGGAALAAYKAVLAAGRAAVAAAGVAPTACLADALAAAVAAAGRTAVATAGRAAVHSTRAATSACLDAGAAFSNAAAAVAASHSVFLPFSYPIDGRVLAVLSASAHLRRIAAGDVVALVTSARFRNQSGPGSCGITILVWCQDIHGSLTKVGNGGAVVAPMLCVSRLNHQAGGDLYIQLH